MWSPLDASQLRARFSARWHVAEAELRTRLGGQFRIVGLTYLSGGGLAAFCLVALLMFDPAAEVVREALGVPLQQLFKELLPNATAPAAAANVESPELNAAVLAYVSEPLASPAATSTPAAEMTVPVHPIALPEVALGAPSPAPAPDSTDMPAPELVPMLGPPPSLDSPTHADTLPPRSMAAEPPSSAAESLARLPDAPLDASFAP
jgi:hypothetical protein